MRKVIFIDSLNKRFEMPIDKFVEIFNKLYISNKNDIVFNLASKENLKITPLIHPKELGKIIIFEAAQRFDYAPAHNIFSLMWAKNFYELGYSVYLIDMANKHISDFQNILKTINPDFIFDAHNWVANQEEFIKRGVIPRVDFFKIGCPIVVLIGELPLWKDGSLTSLKTLEVMRAYNELFIILCHEKQWCSFFKNFGIKNVYFLPHYAPAEFSYPTENMPKSYPISFVGNFHKPVCHLPKELTEIVNKHLILKKQDFGYNFIHQLMREVFTVWPSQGWEKLEIICNQIGANFENMRYFILKEIINHHRLILFGTCVPKEFKEHPNVKYEGPAHWLLLPIIFGMTAINLNIHRIVFDTSTQERSFMFIFSKAFFLADYKEIFKDLFPTCYKEFTFKTVDELLKKIDYYLHHEDERKAISEELYKTAIESHTLKHRAKTVLELLGKKYSE
ncbi:glycosyltransferase family protein [Desulfonauticus submarinus]